jgi:hypothetical protein
MRALCFIAASILAASVAQACDHDHHHDHKDHHIDHLLLDLGLAEDNVESMMDIAELDEDPEDPSSPMLRSSLRDLRHHKKRKSRRKKAPPCLTNDPSPEGEMLMDSVAAARKQARSGARQGIIAENGTANVYSPIRVYWNVMKAGETAKLGAWSTTDANLVMAGLNEIYNNTPFKFTLAGVTQTTNANWFNCTAAVGTFVFLICTSLFCPNDLVLLTACARVTPQKRPTRSSCERRVPMC